MQSFQKNNEKVGDLTLDKIIDDEIFICQLLRGCSKQNMNTVAIQNICKFIVNENKRDFHLKFEDMINFREFGPKTVSLLLYCVFNKVTTVTVDRHVQRVSKALGWCHSVSEDDEISWHFYHLVPKNMKIIINDACGAIMQYTLEEAKKICSNKKLLALMNKL